MRLIDADALDTLLKDAQTECKRNGGNFRFGVLNNIRENIAKMPTIGGWTSIKDGPPPEYSDCIVFADGYSQPAQYIKDGKFYTPDNYEAEEIKGVTHWMPYPEGPQC